MKRGIFELFITSRKLTSYPWKACQKDIGFNFASKGSKRHSICSILFVFFFVTFFVWVESEQIADTKTRKGCSEIQQGSWSSGEVHLRAKCCLMASSCYTVRQLNPSEHICPEYTDTLYRRSHPVNQTGMSPTITSGCIDAGWGCT